MKIQDRLKGLGRLLADFQADAEYKPVKYDNRHRWSVGDVENNDIFYHPQLTHYAHLAFEHFCYSERGIQYSDLSGREERHKEAREKHSPGIIHG